MTTTVGDPSRERRLAHFLLLAFPFAAGAALWSAVSGPLAGVWAPAFLRGYAAAWVCYLVAALIICRSRRKAAASPPPSEGLAGCGRGIARPLSWPRWVLIWIVVAAIGLRAVALTRTLPLSTDIWRYLWDGRVANAGINPYRYPPNAPELRRLRD